MAAFQYGSFSHRFPPVREPIGIVISINRSVGGVPKLPVSDVFVSEQGLDGDGHRFHMHGGPDKAVCVYAIEIIEALQREGHPIAIGTTGENVTVRGVDWKRVVPGARLVLGEVEIAVTGYASPCQTIIGSFADERSKRISQKVHPGWSRVYGRVIQTGTLRVGDAVGLYDATKISAGKVEP